MNIKLILTGAFLSTSIFVVLGIMIFYYPQIGKIGKSVHQLHLTDQALINGVNNAYEINVFQDKPYAFFSNPEHRKPFLVSINDGKKILIPNASDGEQIFGTFNDGNVFYITATESGNNGIHGAIYRTLDMVNFERVHSSNDFGYRSIIKFKGKFVAGTDSGDGRLSISDDGIKWHDTPPTTDLMPVECNIMAIFKDKLYFASNGGVIATSDMKSFSRVLSAKEKGFQIWSISATPERLYVGTSSTKDSHVYVYEEGGSFQHLVTIANVPILFSILGAGISTDEILITGTGGKIFKINARSGNYSPFYDTGESYVYIARRVGDSVFFGASNGHIYRYGPHLTK